MLCYNDNSGTATVNVSGGTPPYTYAWTGNVSNTNSASNLAAGSYTVTITDNNGCVVTNTISLTEPPQLQLQTISTADPACYGSCDGIISVSATGGTPSYSYVWSDGNTSSSNTNLCSGSYSVTLTDNNGCTATNSYTLNDPAALVASISSFTDLLCNNQCTGSATVSVTNGTAPFSYSWSNNNNAQTVNNLCSGIYTVTVLDASGCTATTSVTISEPPALTATIPSLTATLCYGDCNGSATVVVNGGTPYYTYNWSSGNSDQATNDQLCAGFVTVTITDANGCTTTTSTTIPQPSELVITHVDYSNLTCNGSNNGSIDIYITGGVGTWYYSINSNQTDTVGHFENLAAGTYTITVTDSRGCSKTTSVTLTEPAPVVVSGQTYYSICHGEFAYPSVNAQGGTAPYTFYWNGQPGSNAIGVQPTTNTSYTVYATDANQCSSNTLTINIAVSTPLSVDIQATPNAVCPGSSVELQPFMFNGGGPPYLIKDQYGNVLSPPIIIYPQQTGYYILYVQDVCGSIAHDSVYITVYPLPEVNFVSDTVSGCEPLTVTFHPMISSPGQQYVWHFGDGSINDISFEQNPTHTFMNDGEYDISLTITSPNGCVNSYTHHQMIRVYPTPDARFTYNPQIVSIVKPEVHFTNISTDADWYIWSFGDGDSSNIVNPYHWYKNVGVYMVELIALTNKGCKDTARSYVTVRPEFTFFAPTYISPDYDGLNDIFYVVGTGITSKNFKMYIYDRWGEIIYETDKYDPTNPTKYGWDGLVKNNKPAPPGTYTWLVKYTDPDNVQHEVAGSVTIVK